MNHRRKRTTRREMKRNSRKKLRGAERAAMDGRNPDTVALEWRNGKMNAQVPVVNEVPQHRRVSNKPRPKKTKCAQGGTHTWVRSITETREFYREEIRGECARCIKLSKDWERMAEWYHSAFTHGTAYDTNPHTWSIRWGRCHDHGPKVYYSIKFTYRTCSKCGLSQRLDVDNERWNYRRKNLVLPRRTVKLY